MLAQAARHSAQFGATHSFAAARGFGLAGSRFQTMVKPVMAAPAKTTSLWSRLGLQAIRTTKQPLVYSTKARKFAASTATIENVAANRPIAYWIFGTAAMVGGMIAVGGATRLTRSGLSMVQWKPQGSLPPMTPEEWEAQFEIYKQFPEYQQRKNMTVEDFKGIFWWEYGHRMLGRTVGMVYTAPLIYFMLRKRLPRELYTRFGVLFSLGAAQGAVGWWMVRSGLEEHGHEQLQKRNEVRVSPYRLATHLGFAFTTLGVLLWTGFNLVAPPSRAAMTREMISPDVLKQVTRIRKILGHVSTALGYTILSGAFVAGIDAGMAYNTFPKMDEQWIPDDLFVLEPKYKNFFENVPLVQLDHRVLALSTLAGFGGVYGLARRQHIWNQLPQQSRNALNMALAAAGGQVLLGITTLISCVPIPLGISHQCGAIALMTATLWSQHTLNFAKPLKKAAQAAIKAAPKTLTHGHLRNVTMDDSATAGDRRGMWAMVKEGYEGLVSTVIRPLRAQYTPSDLGPKRAQIGDVSVQRVDLRLKNPAGYTLECSWWKPRKPKSGETQEQDKHPCIVVLHGNSSCRLGALEIVMYALPAGFTVFALDFSGSGLSEGNLPRLATELVEDGKLGVPKIAVKLVMRLIRRDIKKRAKFDMFKLKPIAKVHKCSVPAFFVVGLQDELVGPHHVEALYKLHNGPNQLFKFPGGHNSPRPFNFFIQALQFLRVMVGLMPLPDDLSTFDLSPAQRQQVQYGKSDKKVSPKRKKPSRVYKNPLEPGVSIEAVHKMAIKELKQCIDRAGYSDVTCIEKKEMVDLVLKLYARYRRSSKQAADDRQPTVTVSTSEEEEPDATPTCKASPESKPAPLDASDSGKHRRRSEGDAFLAAAAAESPSLASIKSTASSILSDAELARRLSIDHPSDMEDDSEENKLAK
ncbi:Alpha/Beta hydrolase fold [Phytophthora cactorum]|nr:Alpha/Beta hydrolase fold [Phytophthora cactorum]